MKPDINLLVQFAHRGCIEAIAEAERRLILLEKFGVDAVVYPALHNFSPEFHREDLRAENQIKKLKTTIENAKRIGLLCEKFKDAFIRHDIEAAFDNLETEKKGRRK